MSIQKNVFIPSFLKSALSGSRTIVATLNDTFDSNIQSTSSFLYDPAQTALKSTTQLNVDWTQFSNHTFFMSAEAKTNIAFDLIINRFPFDGTRAEVEHFYESITGFDTWVLSQFPKFLGQLQFNNSWLQVKDAQGALFPELAKTATGASVLTPDQDTSMSWEMMLKLPPLTNGYQIIAQKMTEPTLGYVAYLKPTASTTDVTLAFSIISGSQSVTSETTILKDTWNHICLVSDRENRLNCSRIWLNNEYVAQSDYQNFETIKVELAEFTVASGSSFTTSGVTVTPTTTLTGSMDELRYWHQKRTTKQLLQNANKSVYAQDGLKLYYKFNEPVPPLVSDPNSSINSIVLDSSGNSLHCLVQNFTSSLKQDTTADPTSKMYYERPETSPVLFATHPGVVSLNESLLTSASFYDSVNPNLITKLVPQHYLLVGQAQDGSSTIGESYTSLGLPGQGEFGSAQILLTFLYTYARFFDEMKLFVDSFRNLRYVNYDSSDTMPDNFLLNAVKEYGFNLPPLFTESSIEQFYRGADVELGYSTTSDYTLKQIQNELIRRTLVNLPSIIRSKGTQYSIKAFLRSMGIDPDTTMRFRESGGPTERSLSNSRESRKETGVMTRFITSSYVKSAFLTGSRIEPGFPLPAGSFTYLNGRAIGTTNPNDKLLTSGSWTVEGIFKWDASQVSSALSVTQSLFRLNASGTNLSKGGIQLNVLGINSEDDPRLVAYMRPGSSSALSDAPILKLELPIERGTLFDGQKWNVSFSRTRNDDPQLQVPSFVSSSYTLSVGLSDEGKVGYYASTSSFFQESLTGLNTFSAYDVTYNISGSYLEIGSGTSTVSGSGSTYRFLNDTSSVPQEARSVFFNGSVSNMRFWSRALLENEWREHIRNYKSRGVYDPKKNFNYATSPSGSYEKLRLETFCKQSETDTNVSGSIQFLDFSENGLHLLGTGFGASQRVMFNETFEYSHISPNFDDAVSDDKIRVRGYSDYELVKEHPWSQYGTAYEIPRNDYPTDTTKFAIDFSLIDSLNKDIITIFSTMQEFENALGSPNLMFSPDYPDIVTMRDVYFNRIKGKLNFESFFEFFRWFDTSIGTFIDQLVPRKTNFKGTNFVIESHMLERHKHEYKFNEMYLGDSNRTNIQDSLYLQQITGQLNKF